MLKKTLCFCLVMAPALAAAITGSFWFVDSEEARVDLSQLSAQSSSGLVCCTLWCSRCASCRRVEGELQQLCSDMRGKVTVVAVDASAFDNASSILAYISATKLSVPVLRDPVGGLADRLNIDLTTTTVVFDSHQAVRYFGQFGSARQALLELLNGQPVTTPVTPLQGCPIVRTIPHT